MKFTVYYNDDRSHSETVEANTHDMAAWKFVQAHPRPQPAQLTVVVSTKESRHFGAVVTWWSSAFSGQPAPEDEAVPELKLIATGGREPCYEICGTPEALKLLGTQLLDALARRPHGNSPDKSVYGVAVQKDDGWREVYLDFIADPKRTGESITSDKPLFIILLLVLGFASVGLIATVRYFF